MNGMSSPLISAGCFNLLVLIARDAVASKLKFQINDAEGASVPCRIHLLDAAGKPVEAPGLPF